MPKLEKLKRIMTFGAVPSLMARKVKLHSCLAVGGYYHRHGRSCLSAPFHLSDWGCAMRRFP